MTARPCPKCGADLNMVGRAHNCRPRLETVDDAGLAEVQRPIDAANARIKEAAQQQRARTKTGGKINVKSKTRGPRPRVGGGGGVRPPAEQGTASAAGPRRGRPKGEETEAVTLRLPPGLIERLDSEASKLSMTRTALVRIYLEKGLS